jgi:hypothetical protein
MKKVMIAILFAILGSAGSALAQQQTSDDNPLLRVLEGVLTQVEPAQTEAPSPPGFPNTDCAVSKVSIHDGAVVIRCQQPDEWGFQQFFVRTDGTAPREKADQGALALEMALTVLSTPSLVLNAHYASREVPPIHYCGGSLDAAPNTCREIRTLSVRNAR